MESEIELDGCTYTSTKVAAKELDYTQDYVGQLARSGEVNARKVSGRWYVELESLKNHKAQADEYVPVPPSQETKFRQPGAVVMFDGKEYISSKRGAEITGYSQDYIGQLARHGKIASRYAGSRWLIAKEDLAAHKKHNDALLAEVQAKSVGLREKTEEPAVHEEITHTQTETLSYVREEKDLLPNLSKPVYDIPHEHQAGTRGGSEIPEKHEQDSEEEDSAVSVPIRVRQETKASERPKFGQEMTIRRQPMAQRSIPEQRNLQEDPEEPSPEDFLEPLEAPRGRKSGGMALLLGSIGVVVAGAVIVGSMFFASGEQYVRTGSGSEAEVAR